MDIISVFQKVVTDPSMSWVLFKNGTCVMPLNSEVDVRTQAMKILEEHGSVVAGTPSGDFEVTKISEIGGWIVTGAFPGIMMYVSDEEAGREKSDFKIGMIGRTKKEQDATSLEVVHIEDKANT